MFTIQITRTINGSVEAVHYFNRFSEAYQSLQDRANELSYDVEVDGDIFTAGGRGRDYTITLFTNN